MPNLTIEQQQLFEKLSSDRQENAKVLEKESLKGVKTSVTDKYSDQAHFIYELLQNADDVQATKVRFILNEQRLIFAHNGKIPFSVSDPGTEKEDGQQNQLGHINAITSIGHSTKNEAKIGKFGVGFKAVFQYTNTPHIYDEPFRFKIERFIVPMRLEQDHPDRPADETWFYFPFDIQKTADKAFPEILGKLKSLTHPLLFLRNLTEITWTATDKGQGQYVKSVETLAHSSPLTTVERVTLEESVNQKTTTVYFLTLTENLSSDQPTHLISIAYAVNKDNQVLHNQEFPAYCFFLTKEQTKLRFIVQAPFLLTDSREGIKQGEDWNKQLVNGLAKLTANSLSMVKKLKLLNDNFFNVLPMSEEEVAILFKPIYHEVLRKLQSKDEELLPTQAGNFVNKKNAYLAETRGLRELLTVEQLGQVVDNPKARWVFPGITGGSSLREYVKSNLTANGRIIASSDFANRIDHDFMSKRSDEWLVKLYTYLLEGPRSLWKETDSILRTKPIIRLTDNNMVSPYNASSGKLQAYLPTEIESEYPTVKKCFVEDKKSKSRQFLEELGLKVPDEYDEITHFVIPRYEKGGEIEVKTLLEDFKKLLNYREKCPYSKKEEYVNTLKNLTFCMTQYLKDNKRYRVKKKPSEIYFRTPELETYFRGQQVYFFHKDFYKEVYDTFEEKKVEAFLRELGVADKPRLIEFHGQEVKLNPNEKKRLRDNSNHQRHGNDNDDDTYDYDIDKLNQFVSNISNVSDSKMLWDLLLKLLKESPSIFYGQYSWYYHGNRHCEAHFDAQFLKTLQQFAWLYDKNGNHKKPSDITVLELPEDYNTNTRPAMNLISHLKIPDETDKIWREEQNKWREEQRKKDENYGKLEKIAASKGKTVEEYLADLENNKHKPTTSSVTLQRTTGEVSSKADNLPVTSSTPNLNITTVASTAHQVSSPSLPRKPRIQNVNDVKIDNSSEDEDDEELIPASVKVENLAKRRTRLENLLEQEVAELTKIEELKTTALQVEKYSFHWFKTLLELEYLLSYESKSRGREIRIEFRRVETDHDSDNLIILRYPSRYIPHTIEDIADVSLHLYFKDNTNARLSLEVVNVKEYTLRARLQKPSELQGIDLTQVVKAVIDVKNPTFILEELRKAFGQLSLADDDNLRDMLPEDIEFIFGPPGTGKTSELASRLVSWMQESEDLKILVLTPTNKAADVLVRKILEELEEDASYEDWLVRFGVTGDNEIEQLGLLKERTFNLSSLNQGTVVTTLARFIYDSFRNGSEVCKLKDYDWDVIVIDEASMVMLAGITYVLYQQPNCKFIISGDPFQIPPVVIAEEWKEENIYKLVGLNSFQSPQTAPPFEVKTLTTQYRSLPPLGKLFSGFSYDGILEHDRDHEDKKPLKMDGLDLTEITIIKFPVNPFQSLYRPQRLEERSSYQIYSALFTVELALYLSNEITKHSQESWKIGIICPYAAQATLVEKIIAKKWVPTPKVEIQTGTIHGFQGDECDIILDLLNPPPTISPKIFLNNQNILNVSISRARDYLILIVPEETEGLTRLEKLLTLIQTDEKIEPYYQEWSAADIEEIIFQQANYIYDNCFVTTHQSVNVYSTPDKKYEVRCEDNAIDVQVFS